MKVICKDNYDRDTVPDTLVAKDLPRAEAMKLAGVLNAKASPHGDAFFVAVEDGYTLFAPQLP